MIWLLLLTINGKEESIVAVESFDTCFSVASVISRAAPELFPGCRPINFVPKEKP